MKTLFARLFILLVITGSGFADARNFKVQDLEGNTHELSSYRGKWVVVNFWATWCSPCLAEMPDFEAAWQARKDKDLVILGVALDYDDPKDIREFIAKRKVHYPMILGNDKIAASIVGKEGVPNLPMTLIFSPDGKERFSGVGKMSREKLESLTRLKHVQPLPQSPQEGLESPQHRGDAVILQSLP